MTAILVALIILACVAIVAGVVVLTVTADRPPAERQVFVTSPCRAPNRPRARGEHGRRSAGL